MKAQVRAIRFHDRHTDASVLLMPGANAAKRRGRNPFGFPRGSGLVCGGEYGTRTRGLRRDRPAL